MQGNAGRIAPQPLIALGTTSVALLLLVQAWLSGLPQTFRLHDGELVGIALFLLVGLVLSYPFPFQIRLNTKVGIGSVPLYLMAALLPPWLAATAAGLGVFLGHLVVHSERGTYLSDIVTEAGRWLVIALLGSVVAHLPLAGQESHVIPLAMAGTLLWLADIITLPLAVGPITGEAPWQIITGTMRKAGLVEASQYVVGLLGAVVALQHIWGLILLTIPTILVYFAFKNAQKVNDGTRRMLEGLADTVDQRDPFTEGHSQRVAELCPAILKELGVQGREAEDILLAARVFDIGKLRISDETLRKTSPLTAAERAEIELHPENGADLLLRYPDFGRSVAIVRHHHERWDGTGYPHRLRETQIPLGSRVIAVSESFVAITSNRSYRRGLPVERAVSLLREGRGRQWDPTVVDALIHTLGDQLQTTPLPMLQVVPRAEGTRNDDSETA